MSSYPADRGARAEHYHNCNRVQGVSEGRLFYEVDCCGGKSGAPVWIHEQEDAPPPAVGIHAHGIGGMPSSFGIAADSAPRSIPAVLEHLTEEV